MYTPKTWENAPSTASPINAESLNHIEQGVADAHTGLSFFKRSPGGGSTIGGDVNTFGPFAYAPTGVGNVWVAGGAANNENIVGGNPANVDTSTSNLLGAAPLGAAPNGNWNYLLGGYDNVVRGWATCVAGFHHKVLDDANHITIGGGSKHTVNASVAYGTIGGGTGHKLTGSSSTVAGGETNEAAQSAVVAGGVQNKASGVLSTLGGGYQNEAQGQSSTVAGGYQNAASGQYGTVLGGLTNTASGLAGTAAGGRSNSAAADYSLATGRDALTADKGQHAHAGGSFTVAGDAQVSVTPIKRQTADATAADLQCEGGLPPTIPENATWAFSCLVVARRSDADGENAAWEVRGLLKRDAGNTAALVGTPTVTPIASNAGNAWTLTVGTYSTGNLRFIVTGEAAKTIRWVGRLEVSQVQG